MIKPTYSKMYAVVYGHDYQDNQHMFANTTASTDAAWEIIRLLNGRAGFVEFWEGGEAETRDEIFDKIRNIIEDIK